MSDNTEKTEQEVLKSIFTNWTPYEMPEDSDELDVQLVGKSFDIKWCETCGATYVRCPKCGNNSCNGGYGEDKDGNKCNVCPVAYELMYALGRATKADSEAKE